MGPLWDDMKVFLAVAREASLSGAGRVLKMDPATVGRRISRFEEAMDAALFVKTPQGYALNAAGDRLLAHAETAEQAMRSGQEALSGPSDTLSGQIRLGAPDGCANYILPQVCARISKDHPDLDIQIVALPRGVNLSRREADMAVTVSAPTSGQLLVEKICDYKLHLVASRHYLRDAAPIENLEDLKDHKMIGYIPDMIFDRELDYLNEFGVERVALASTSVSVQIKLAAQGGALCVAHDFCLPSHRMLRKILNDKISLTRSFHLVRHQGDQRSERINRFADALQKGIRDEVETLEALT
ncbi:LysR family transcriptional regulator [Epibacterium ulvae]|uniref:LysR family transcriptional regulator n=1 Tax=Epibacterium ulvae TaxID=1156985 RepID=UPI002492FE42|nr:LysR family transcriptional regulator [Epibacterium ulvae]